MQITPNRLSISNLLGTANEQYLIPAYQRRYSWRKQQVADLYDDINQIESNDNHLLGSIVCLTGNYKTGLNTLEVVDGQQRITTLLILMECLRERMKNEGEEAIVHDLDRLLSARDVDGTLAPKILLDSLDSREFSRLAKRDTGGEFRNQNLQTAFSLIRSWIADEPIEQLRRFAYHLQTQAVIIRLDVNQAKDAFKLFEIINNRGLRLSPTDIVKNFLLGNAARFDQNQLETAREEWAKIIAHLDGVNTDTFLRYYLSARLRRRVTASYVVSSFKELFMRSVKEAESLPERHQFIDDEAIDDDEDDQPVAGAEGASQPARTFDDDQDFGKVGFSQFLAQLVQSAKVYAELVLAKTGDKRIDRRLRNLQMIRAHQTYGFLMYLRVNQCSDKHFLAILRLTEALMLRRQVCKERSNENDTLFGSLCEVDPKEPVEETRRKYREACPTDEKFELEFSSTNYKGNLMDRARYCLESIELSLHGKYDELDVLGADSVHVEHIIPQKITTKRSINTDGDWLAYLGPKAGALHGKHVGRIGNLTLFSGTLNIGASNNPFHRKRNAYKKSGLLLNAELARMPNFRFEQVEKRSRHLARLASGLWPVP